MQRGGLLWLSLLGRGTAVPAAAHLARLILTAGQTVYPVPVVAVALRHASAKQTLNHLTRIRTQDPPCHLGFR